jgi:hypothetical protein
VGQIGGIGTPSIGQIGGTGQLGGGGIGQMGGIGQVGRIGQVGSTGARGIEGDFRTKQAPIIDYLPPNDYYQLILRQAGDKAVGLGIVLGFLGQYQAADAALRRNLGSPNGLHTLNSSHFTSKEFKYIIDTARIGDSKFMIHFFAVKFRIPNYNGTVIQLVETTETRKKDGKVISTTKRGLVEGWRLVNGNMSEFDIDSHLIQKKLTIGSGEEIEIMTKFTVGAGLYKFDRIPATGQSYKPFAETADAENIQWLGPTKTYERRIIMASD